MNSLSETSGACLICWGASTAIGESAAATAAAVRAGVTGFVDHPQMFDMNRDPFVVAASPVMDFTTSLVDRMASLAETAAGETLGVLEGVDGREREISVLLGLPERRAGQPEDMAGVLKTRLKNTLGANCGIRSFETLNNGHAAGMMAIGQAVTQVNQGDSGLFLVGGVDSYIDDETLGWLEDSDQLHNGTNPYGFTPGEAAGFALICSGDTARRLGLNPQVTLLGCATTTEKYLIKTDTVSTGEGMTAAYREVLSGLPGNDAQVDQIITDQNGEIYRANEYGFSLVRTNRHFVDGNDFLAPADCWGDVGAASGPLFLGLVAAAADKGYGKGPLSLLTTSAEGGQRSVALAYAAVKPKEPA